MSEPTGLYALDPGPQRGDLRETVGAECHCHGREEPARVMPRQRPAPQQQGAGHLQIVLGSANRFCQPSPALRGLRDVDSPPWLPAGIIAFTLEELFEVAGVLMNQLLLLSETPARLPQSKSRDRGDSAWCADDHEKARGSTYFRLALEAIALPPMQSTPTTVNARPRMKPIPAPMLAPPPSADVTILKRHDTSARTSPKIRITKPALVAAFMPTPFKQGLQYPRSDFYQICVRRDNRCWLPPNMRSLADSRPRVCGITGGPKAITKSLVTKLTRKVRGARVTNIARITCRPKIRCPPNCPANSCTH